MNKKCETCEHAVFDELWGEFKCEVRHIRCYPVPSFIYCKDYKEKKNDS